MITFEIERTERGQFAVYERLADGRRWNCRAVVDTEVEAQSWADRFAETEARIDAMPKPAIPDDAEYCWECGQPILDGDGVMDGPGWAHRSCVGA